MLHNRFALSTGSGWGGGTCPSGVIPVTHWSGFGPFCPPNCRKLYRGSAVCFFSLAPDCSIPPVPTSLSWWQETEQLRVSPLPSTSVSPAPGWLWFWTATSCLEVLHSSFAPLLPHHIYPSWAVSAHSWCSQVMAMKLPASKPWIESVYVWDSSFVNLP